MSLCDQYELWNGRYLVRLQVSMVFLRLKIHQSAAGCISGGTKVGYILEQEYFELNYIVKNEFKYLRKKYFARLFTPI